MTGAHTGGGVAIRPRQGRATMFGSKHYTYDGVSDQCKGCRFPWYLHLSRHSADPHRRMRCP